MDVPMSTMVLATDGSDGARLAARAAADLSKATGAQLHVAHAWRFVPRRAGYPAMTWTEHAHLHEREARRVLDAEASSIEEALGVVGEPHLLNNPPVDAILDLCEELEPDLLVVGGRGLGPLRRLLVGSVCEGVAHHARCPVLVVRGGEEAWPPQRVVVGDDGSDGARRAGELATRLGGLLGAGVTLVRARRNPPEPTGSWSAEDRRKLGEVTSREEDSLNERAKALQEVSGSRPRTRVVEADPALALLTVAEERDDRKTLLAVGSRGLGFAKRGRLGGVCANVLRVDRGPVLICPRGVPQGNAVRDAPWAASATRWRPGG
jgi:nucleotide-binding universal stress UspA family protein